MPLIEYTPRNFQRSSLEIIDQANTILAEYAAQGFVMTLRQLYYQFVARDLIPNNMRSYNRIKQIVNDARLAGLIDWNHLEDRTRQLRGPTHWRDPAHILQAAVDSYLVDKWEGQKYRPEVWIEKDALTGVIEDVCNKLDICYFSCRGYPSQSEVWRHARRYSKMLRGNPEQLPYIIHLGDHDPSGVDMTRDIEDRLQLFLGTHAPWPVMRIALNYDQITQYEPPANPAKITDSRCKAYMDIYGEESWELDALEPQVIVGLIRECVDSVRDDKLFDARYKLQEEHRATLQRFVDQARGDKNDA